MNRDSSADLEQPLQDEDEHMHYSHRAPWLRAFVLGANDGLVSVSSLMLGVGAGSKGLHAMQLAGLAGLVSGATSRSPTPHADPVVTLAMHHLPRVAHMDIQHQPAMQVVEHHHLCMTICCEVLGHDARKPATLPTCPHLALYTLQVPCLWPVVNTSV